MPRTATGKIKRFLLQKEIEEKGYDAKAAPAKKHWIFTAEDESTLASNVGQILIEAIKQISDEANEIHPGMNLEIDLGLDSLARAEVFACLEQAFNIEFDSGRAAGAVTVGEVIKLTRELTGEAQAEVAGTNFDWGEIIAEADESLPEMQNLPGDHPIFAPVAFALLKIAGWLSRLLFGLEVAGADELAKIEGPYLICPNHQSYLDPLIVASAYPYDVLKKTFSVGASDYFRSGLMQRVARLLNVVAIDPDTQLLKAIKASATGLKRGGILNIYPEGERTFDGELHAFKKGAAILAVELDLMIVPVALDGLYKVWARSSRKISLAKVKVRFGKPFSPKEIVDASMDGETKYQAVTEHLKQQIQTMIDKMRKP